VNEAQDQVKTSLDRQIQIQPDPTQEEGKADWTDLS
jgi:hypothetical protein